MSKFEVQAEKRRRLKGIRLVGILPDIRCHSDTSGFKDETPFCYNLSQDGHFHGYLRRYDNSILETPPHGQHKIQLMIYHNLEIPTRYPLAGG